MERAEAIFRLEGLLEKARAAVASSFAELGRPFTTTESRPTVESNADGTGWSSGTAEIEINTLAREWSVSYEDVLGSWLEDARVLAGAFARDYEANLPIWSPLSPSVLLKTFGLSREQLDDKAGSALVLGIAGPTRWYLGHLPSVDSPDESLARRVAGDAIDVLESGRATLRQTIALTGIESESDLIQSPGSRLRTLSPLERGDFYRSPDVMRPDRLPFSEDFHLHVPSHMLEVDSCAPLAQEILMLPVPSLILALQLHGIELAGPGRVVKVIQPSWVSVGASSWPIPMREDAREGSEEVTQEVFDDAVATADSLKEYSYDPPSRPAELALHRFALGCARSDNADCLLDFVVALEALLLPFDRALRSADLAYRFRVHGAHFIADSPDERREVFEKLQELYKLRSRLVHGAKYPDARQTADAAADARQLAARGLLKAVARGFPTADEFTTMMLS